ncbi:glutamate 5-kinase [Paenibacillus sp. FSL H7-0326]|uniref:glutamate 5-kinase n=1 Tax=Paenibacillus sp. FSL H7-0326 TaxID=1921144 RepID=UPI00096F41BC|nr:glutamate 5-kinase [Paenibacillus sp. FSL H7-0326]OMC68499.1 glutamate 5-kinase [Paenibacillus sp. FSL H7-0326]
MSSRIVVKIGSSSLTTDSGSLNHEAVSFYASEIAALHQAGHEVLLVTSGAVAAGFGHIGYETRPKLLHEKQAAAAVGQALLMQAYQQAFAHHHIKTAQILLTRTDFTNRKRMGNAGMTIDELLKQNVIPVINENDTVSVDELKFGDNDMLSALVAGLTKAKKLIILTDTDGLYTADPRYHADAKHYDRIDEITDEIYEVAGGSGSLVGTGGMRSKVDAAKVATRGGVPVFVGRVNEPGDLLAATADHGKGTYFDTRQNSLSRKKQWLGFISSPLGSIHVDQGAEEALIYGGHSLLPVGVRRVEGQFHAGDVIEVVNLQGTLIGRGIVNYDAEQLRSIIGLPSPDVLKKLEGSLHRLEVVHRDEWITLK